MTETNDPDAESESPLQEIPWRRIANVVGLIVLVAIVVPFVVYAVPQVVGADHSYVVLSSSMEPAMSPGDAVIVNSVAPAKITAGDVITYGGGGGDPPTTHRVVEVVERDGDVAFRTRGDNVGEDVTPEVVTPDEVQGRVMSIGGFLFVLPYIGHVIQFANTQVGFVLFLAVPLVLLVGSEIWSIIAAARTDQPDAPADGGDDAPADTSASVDSPDAGLGSGGAAGTSDGTAGASGPDPTADSDSGSDADDAGITFSPAELQLALVVLAAFLAYSAWVTYRTVEVWAFGVTGAVGAAFVLLSGLYVLGGGSDDASASADDGDPTDGPSAGVTATPTSGSGSGAGSTDRDGDVSPKIDTDAELNILSDVAGKQGGKPGVETRAAGHEGGEQPRRGDETAPDRNGQSESGTDEQTPDGRTTGGTSDD